jgi:hypothetical protein
MYADVLGRLTQRVRRDGKPDGGLEGKFDFRGEEVSVAVDPDDEELDVTLWRAKEVLSNLEIFERKAKEKILQECFSSYNDDWRQQDSPVLSEDQFLQRIQLVHIWFLGVDGIDFMYSDGGMFGGHSLISQSFDGENFTYVQMYG